MAGPRASLLVALILLSVALQATDAGETGQQAGSPRSRAAWCLPPLLERARGPGQRSPACCWFCWLYWVAALPWPPFTPLLNGSSQRLGSRSASARLGVVVGKTWGPPCPEHRALGERMQSPLGEAEQGQLGKRVLLPRPQVLWHRPTWGPGFSSLHLDCPLWVGERKGHWRGSQAATTTCSQVSSPLRAPQPGRPTVAGPSPRLWSEEGLGPQRCHGLGAWQLRAEWDSNQGCVAVPCLILAPNSATVSCVTLDKGVPFSGP